MHRFNHDFSSRFRILKGGKISLVVSALLASVTISFASPTDGVVTSGTATIAQNGTTTNITQSTNKATINWQNFSVAGNETVNFSQPNVNSVTLNRVIGNERSVIDGALNANGQVWILNSNGILFNKTAKVNTAGILATTKNISDTDFNSGNYKFTGESTASVINMGTIETSDSGYVAMLANTVSNDGTLKAYKGTVHLVGANEATINLGGNSIVSLTVNKSVLDALVENKNIIQADGGKIYLTTNAVDEILKGVVNNTGVIEAKSIDDITGAINLSGNIVVNNGTLNATGAKGGNIQSTANLIIDAGTSKADGTTGNGGIITQNSNEILQSSVANLSANSQSAKGGTISLASKIVSGNQLYLSGNMSATGNDGGVIQATSDKVTLAGATIDASGVQNGGNIKIGGGWQGADTSIDNASSTTVTNTNITNSGENGKIVVWSDKETLFGGNIKAKGSMVEVSSKESLGFGGVVDAKSLLLDPKNIEIKDLIPGISYLAIPNPNTTAGDMFGYTVSELSNGNLVVTAIGSDINGGATNVGRVYLFSGTGTLISTLSGSTMDDNLGMGGITALTNGNYVVNSLIWDNGSAVNAGAVTWGNKDTGVSGVVSASNSLVGSTGFDQVGGSGVTALTNGNYVVRSSNWDNGSAIDAGAVTWGDGATGGTRLVGIVSASNSLVGYVNYDLVGNKGIAALANGNYVVASDNWDNLFYGNIVNAGAVTWGNGTTGISGAIDSSNSLVGSKAYDNVGLNGITALTNGNYVARSSNWDNGSAIDAGAVTWGDGATNGTRLVGSVSATNSLVGSKAYDNVGFGGVIALTNGNYVVSSASWDNGSNVDTGAVTWGNGATGVKGVISDTNSLVGSKSSDSVGNKGIAALTNGNYVVNSSNWDNGSAINAGAVTWGDGATGTKGVVSSSNSLVGSNVAEQIGLYGVTALTNGNYVVRSPGLNNKSGAVTWGDGATSGTRLVGVISASNSLVGSSGFDQIGLYGVTALTNGNYVVSSADWDNGFAENAGAVTWGDGATGTKGVVSSSNSLVGSNTGNNVGRNGITALTNGNYVVTSTSWTNGSITNAGAVTWGDGATGTKGVVSSSNSLVGSNTYDQVGFSGIIALTNGNYVVKTAYWNNGSTVDTGAVTFGNGATNGTRLVGAISATNSFIGTKVGAQIGSYVTPLSGNRVAISDFNDAIGGTIYITDGTISAGTGDPISSATFANNPTANSIITPTAITTLLNAGTAVTLQANNDITVTANLTANNTSGNGGAFSLEAGRNININANIVTDNGNFTAIAGATNAISANKDSGTPTITIASGKSIKAGTGTITLYANGGNFVNNGGATPFTASLTSIYLPSYTNASLGGLTVNGKRYNTTYAGGCLTTGCVLPTSGVNMLYAIAPVLSVKPSGSQTSNYGYGYINNGSDASGFVNGDDKLTSGISGTALFSVDGTKTASGNDNVGVHNVAYTSGLASSLGYTFVDNTSSIGEFTVTKKILSISSAFNVANKTYDGTTTATNSSNMEYIATGVVDENLMLISGTIAFNDKNAGTNKTITATGYSLADWGPTKASNYELAPTNNISTTATIFKKEVSVAGLVATDKIYDGTTNATISNWGTLTGTVGTETLTLNHKTASFNDKDAGTNKTVTATGYSLTNGANGGVASNYIVSTISPTATATISKAPLTITANNDSAVYSDVIPTLSAKYSGFVNGETASVVSGLSITTNATSSSVAGAYTITPSGATATNYDISYGSNGVFTVVPAGELLVRIDNSSVVYGSTPTFSISSAKYYSTTGSAIVTLTSLNTGNDYTVSDGSGVAATFTISGSGTNVGNYDITGTNFVKVGNNFTDNAFDTGTLAITPKLLTVTASGANKTYDGNTNVSNAVLNITGKVGSDDVGATGTGATFSAKNVGTGLTYTVKGTTLSGATKNNYYIGTVSDGIDGVITPKTLTATAITGLVVANKTYDGTTTATISNQGTIDTGIVDETLTLTNGTALFGSKNTGTQTATATGYTLVSGSGGVASNYILDNGISATTTADITKKEVTISGFAVADKVYDGTTTATISNRGTVVTGIANESLTLNQTLGTASFGDKNVGTSKAVTASNFALVDGTGLASNYKLTDVTNATTTANVTKKEVTISGFTVANKTYDGTITATISNRGTVNTGVTGESLTLNQIAGTASFDNKNAGTNKTITASGFELLDGTGLTSNYKLADVINATTTADITKKELTVMASYASKIYDGTTNVANVALSTIGEIGSDDVKVLANGGTFESKNVGNGLVYTANGATLSGSDKDNYSIATNGTYTGIGEIVAKTLTVINGVVVDNKVYDGTKFATISNQGTVDTGVAGETLILTNGTALFGNANAGNGKTATVTGFLLLDGTGGLASNYKLADGITATSTANINKKQIIATTSKPKIASTFGQPIDMPTFEPSDTTVATTVKVYNAKGEDVTADAQAKKLQAGQYKIKAITTDENYVLSSDETSLLINSALDPTITIKIPKIEIGGEGKQPSTNNPVVTNINGKRDVTPEKPSIATFIVPQATAKEQTSSGNNTAITSKGVKLGVHEGETVSLVSAPAEGQANARITLSELQQTSANTPTTGEKGGATSNDVKEIRVALAENSIIELINGGVHLPVGVDQEFYVIKADNQKKQGAN